MGWYLQWPSLCEQVGRKVGSVPERMHAAISRSERMWGVEPSRSPSPAGGLINGRSFHARPFPSTLLERSSPEDHPVRFFQKIAKKETILIILRGL